MWLEVILASLLLLVAMQGMMLFDVRRKLQRLQQDMGVLSHNMALAGSDVPTSMLVTTLGRMEKRLNGVELPQTTVTQTYELAQQMAREGADEEQMMDRCGLSRDEARLVRQLYPLSRQPSVSTA